MVTLNKAEGYSSGRHLYLTKDHGARSILCLVFLEICCFYFLFTYPIKFLIFLAILATIGIIYLKPEFGLYSCAAIRFSGIEYGFSIKGLFAFLAIVTFTAWIIRLVHRGEARIYFDQQGKYLLVFLFAGCLSILNTGNFETGFKTLFTWSKDFFFFILVINLVSKSKHINEILSVIIGILTFSVVYGFCSSGLGTYIHVFHLLRMRGFSTDPNYFAITLVMIIPLIFTLLVKEIIIWKRIALSVLFLLFFMGIVFSYSRGGVVGLVSVLGILLFNRRNLKRNLLSIFLIAFVLSQVVPPQFWLRVKSIVNFQADLSIIKRLMLFKTGISMFLHHPFLGIGWGNFVNASEGYIGLFGGLAHNMYLEVLAEMGVIGFIPFIGIIWLALRNFQKGSVGFSDLQEFEMLAISRGLMVGFIGFLISGFFLSVQEYKIFFIMLALSSVLKRISECKICDDNEYQIGNIRNTTSI